MDVSRLRLEAVMYKEGSKWVRRGTILGEVFVKSCRGYSRMVPEVLQVGL